MKGIKFVINCNGISFYILECFVVGQECCANEVLIWQSENRMGVLAALEALGPHAPAIRPNCLGQGLKT